MVWRLRRRKTGAATTPEASAPSPLDPQIEEGMLIAATAIRLAAKNRVIVRTMGDREPFDEEWFAGTLREDIEALIAEREEDAERLDQVRSAARRRLGRPQHFHDYRRADLRPLALRAQVDLELAQRLRTLLDDEEFMRATLEAARESALDDVVMAHQSRQVDLTGFERDERYVAERDERVESVRRDLEALQRARSW